MVQITTWLDVDYVNAGDESDVEFSDDIDMTNGDIDNIDDLYGDSGNIDMDNATGIIIDVASVDEVYVAGDLYVEDDLDVGGTKNCMVELPDGRKLLFSAVESPEVWFEEKISSQLVDGKKEIILDERFIKSTTIDSSHPMHVIVTPTSECSGLWVEKKVDRVIVHSNTQDATFDITISAKRKGMENKRFDELVKDTDTGKYYKKSKEKQFLQAKPFITEVEKLRKQRKKIVKEVCALINQRKKKPKDKEKIFKQIDEKRKERREIYKKVKKIRENFRNDQNKHKKI
jgi:hypothetical protein